MTILKHLWLYECNKFIIVKYKSVVFNGKQLKWIKGTYQTPSQLFPFPSLARGVNIMAELAFNSQRKKIKTIKCADSHKYNLRR